MNDDYLRKTGWLEGQAYGHVSIFSSSLAATPHATETRTQSASSNVAPYSQGLSYRFRSFFSFEPFADTLVIVSFVHCQTLAVVLTGPAFAGCLQKNMYHDGRF